MNRVEVILDGNKVYLITSSGVQEYVTSYGGLSIQTIIALEKALNVPPEMVEDESEE